MRKAAAERPWHDPDNAADERQVTPLRGGETYNRVRDVGGSMDADAETRATHWNGQGIHNGLLVLSAEDLRHLAAMRYRSRFW